MTGATWLITGGTGSLGRHLCQRILDKHDPVKVVVYARDAGRHVEMRREMPDPRIRHIVGDVRDSDRLLSALKGVDYVVHAAAQKHIDIGEYNPTETHDINANGTRVVAECCSCSPGVLRSVLISTDKAVEPLNTYGVSKAVAERLWLGKCVDGENVFTVARYGNIVNSDGAILPVWASEEGAERRVTDEHSTRFAMTFDMAIDLIEHALAGPPQAIYCAKARTFSLLDACVAFGGIMVRTGLRDAEKKHEVLVSRYEANHALDCGSYYMIVPEHPADSEIDYALGAPMPRDAEYASNSQGLRMSIDELRAMLGRENG